MPIPIMMSLLALLVLQIVITITLLGQTPPSGDGSTPFLVATKLFRHVGNAFLRVCQRFATSLLFTLMPIMEDVLLFLVSLLLLVLLTPSIIGNTTFYLKTPFVRPPAVNTMAVDLLRFKFRWL